MSFHADLVTPWAADLVTAGIVASTLDVYDGRRPEGVTRGPVEIWLERLPAEGGGPAGGGLQLVDRRPYLVHVRVRSNAGGKKTGTEQLATVEAKLQAIVDRYAGERPFFGESGLEGIVCADAVEEAVDTDPTDAATLDGTVRVTFVVAETDYPITPVGVGEGGFGE